MMSKSKSLPFVPCFSSSKSGLWPSNSSAILKIVRCLSRAMTPAFLRSRIMASCLCCVHVCIHVLMSVVDDNSSLHWKS